MIVVVWGVAGVGKTTVGQLLAEELGWEFYDADSFHPAANIKKMKQEIGLSDADRQPWLEKLRQLIERCLTEQKNAVLACSALKKAYRDRLRVSKEVRFVLLRASRGEVAQHLQGRRGHFMPATLLESQFADLEEPQPGEDALTIEIEGSPHETVESIKARLG